MTTPSRRQFLQLLGAAGASMSSTVRASAGVFGQAPAIVRAEAALPVVDYGVASGDVGVDRALVYSEIVRRKGGGT